MIITNLMSQNLLHYVGISIDSCDDCGNPSHSIRRSRVFNSNEIHDGDTQDHKPDDPRTPAFQRTPSIAHCSADVTDDVISILTEERVRVITFAPRTAQVIR
jgi:hypothetical protein